MLETGRDAKTRFRAVWGTQGCGLLSFEKLRLHHRLHSPALATGLPWPRVR